MPIKDEKRDIWGRLPISHVFPCVNMLKDHLSVPVEVTDNSEPYRRHQLLVTYVVTPRLLNLWASHKK